MVDMRSLQAPKGLSPKVARVYEGFAGSEGRSQDVRDFQKQENNKASFVESPFQPPPSYPMG